jgi:hypothetical protein
MSASAAQRAKSRYRRDLVNHRLKNFSESVDPAAVEASRQFHLRHWLHLAAGAVQKDHCEAFYRGLEPNLESAVAEYPGDALPADLQRAVLADLAFMEGHLAAFREIMQVLGDAHGRTKPK